MKVTPNMVAGFVGSLLSSTFDQATESPEFHKECWELCCSSASKVAIAAPRGHAKTSGVTLGYGLATLLFRERKFMLLVSDTEAQSSMFLGLFKSELQGNTELIELFDLKRDAEGKVLFLKDTETDIIVQFADGKLFRVVAKGAEQKLRGLIWDGKRPDIIMCDDMENDELVMNKDRREKMRRWFYSALLPSIAASGVVRIVGTILHMDSLLERLMPENQLLTNAKKARYMQITPLATRAPGAPTPWRSVRFRAHDADFKNILWPQRNTKEFFVEKYNDFLLQGIPDAYSQEYLNTPLDEASAYFRRNDFLPMTDEDKKRKMTYYITADLAISEAERADYSVFVIAGVDENKMLYIKDVIRDRLDGREIVDLIIRLEQLYHPDAIGIEEMQVTKSIGPFLQEEMVKQNTYPGIIRLKHGGKDKIARSRSIQSRMRAGGVKFDTQADWFSTFQEECTRFPRDRHDDQVDAFSYLGLMLMQLIEAPTKEETQEEEYQDELERYSANGGTNGRSRTTGY